MRATTNLHSDNQGLLIAGGSSFYFLGQYIRFRTQGVDQLIFSEEIIFTRSAFVTIPVTCPFLVVSTAWKCCSRGIATDIGVSSTIIGKASSITSNIGFERSIFGFVTRKSLFEMFRSDILPTQ